MSKFIKRDKMLREGAKSALFVGDFDNALYLINLALDIDSCDIDALLIRANILMSAGRPVEAWQNYSEIGSLLKIAAVREKITNKKWYPALYEQLATFHYRQGHYEKALSAVVQALDACNECPFEDLPKIKARLHTDRADCYYRLGQYGLARGCLSEANTYNSEDPKILLLEGLMGLRHAAKTFKSKLWKNIVKNDIPKLEQLLDFDILKPSF